MLDGLQAIATALLNYGLPLKALPVISLLKHLATDHARDVQQSVIADALSIWALTELGQLRHALPALSRVLSGSDLPLTAAQLPLARPAKDSSAPVLTADPLAPPFSVHLAPEDKANEPALRWLLAAEVRGHPTDQNPL